MNGIIAFFEAAWPWVVMAIALVLFACEENKRNKG